MTAPIRTNRYHEPTTPKPEVHPVSDKPKSQPVFTAHVVFDGFPVDVQFVGSIDQLPATIARLRELGAVPRAQGPAAQAEAEREAPTCPYHGPMKESTKVPGTWFCSSRMGDGSYCKEQHPKR
jgi:hypothetical protein